MPKSGTKLAAPQVSKCQWFGSTQTDHSAAAARLLVLEQLRSDHVFFQETTVMRPSGAVGCVGGVSCRVVMWKVERNPIAKLP